MCNCGVVAIALLYGLGALATLGGLAKAFVDTRRNLRDAKRRIVDMEELGTRPRPDLREVELKAWAEARAAEGGEISAETLERLNAEAAQRAREQAEREQVEYAARGLIRPGYKEMPALALHETEGLLESILRSNIANAVIVGVGVVATTVASIWSLFV